MKFRFFSESTRTQARSSLMLSAVVSSFLGLSLSMSVGAEDLSEIYRQALENDHEFKAAIANSKATAESKNLARAGLLPQLGARVNWSDGTAESTGTQVRPDNIAGTPVGVGEVETTRSGYTISLSQPLFNLAAWHSYKAGRSTADVAEAQLQAAEQSLILRVAQAYFDTLEAADNLETSLAEEKAFKHQLEQSRQRFEVGLSAITEVHESQAVYDSSVARRLNAEGQLGIAFEALEVLTGQTYFQLAPIKSDFDAAAPVPADRQEWVARALDGNAGLAVSKANAKTAEQTAKSSRADHLPTLTLNGSYGDNNEDTFVSENWNSDIDTENQSIGLTLDVPLFSGGATSASRRQAKQRSIEAREQYLKAKRDTVQAARSSHLAVVTSVATVRALKQAIVSNESALEATQAGYSVGTRDLVDVLNAQRGLYQAKRNYFDALYTYVINSLRLKETAGMLSIEDVNQLNAWLDNTNPIQKTSLVN